MGLPHQAFLYSLTYLLKFKHAGDKLNEHLIHLISSKLNDKMLEITCTHHAHNRTLIMHAIVHSSCTQSYTQRYP